MVSPEPLLDISLPLDLPQDVISLYRIKVGKWNISGKGACAASCPYWVDRNLSAKWVVCLNHLLTLNIKNITFPSGFLYRAAISSQECYNIVSPIDTHITILVLFVIEHSQTSECEYRHPLWDMRSESQFYNITAASRQEQDSWW